MRILIAGVPRAGKSTLADELGERHNLKPLHTDDHIGIGWSESSAAVAAQICLPGPWIIEGVAVPRALRKWLAANEGKPADEVYWLPQECVPLNQGQASMGKGCATVWREILPTLLARGVTLRSAYC